MQNCLRFLCSTVILCSVFFVHAATITFNVLSGSWNSTGNWSPAIIPTATDDVIIPAGRTVSGITIAAGSSAPCRNITVNGVLSLAINDGITLAVSNSITGTGRILFWPAQAANKIQIGGNDEFTGFVTSTVGTVEYNGNSAQIITSRSLFNLSFTNVGTKTYSFGGASVFTISGNLSVGLGATFNLSAYAKDLYVMGNMLVNGTLNFGTVNIKNVFVFGNLSGSGSINMGTTPTTNTLNLYGTSNTIGSFISIAGQKVSYSRSGNQTVFASNDYPTLEFGGSGIKTASGNITCSGVNYSGTSVAFSLGTLTTAGYNFYCSGNVVTGNSGHVFDFGSVNPKNVRFDGTYQNYATLNMTGAGLAHHMVFGNNPNPNVINITPGSGSTIEYGGPNSFDMAPILGTYENLIISGSGTKRNGTNITVNGRCTIENGATFDSHSFQARFQNEITIAGSYIDTQDGGGTFGNYGYGWYVTPTGKILTSNATVFNMYNSITNYGVISIAGASTIYTSNAGHFWSNYGTMILGRPVTVVSTRTMQGTNGILFGSSISLIGTNISLINNIPEVTTIAGELVGAATGTQYQNRSGSTTKFFGASPPMFPNGTLIATFSGNTFIYSRNTFPEQTVAGVSYDNLITEATGVPKNLMNNIPSIQNFSIVGGMFNVFPTVTQPISVTGNCRITGTFQINGGTNALYVGGDLFTNNGNGVVSFTTGSNHRLILFGQNIQLPQMPNPCTSCGIVLARNGAQNIRPTFNGANGWIPIFNLSVGGVKRVVPGSTGLLSVSGTLGLHNAVLDMNTQSLVLGPNCTLAPGTFSNLNMITLGGNAFVRKLFSEGTPLTVSNYLIPLGTNTEYSPLILNFSGVTFSVGGAGSVMARAVASVAPNQTDGSFSLRRHWVVSSTGISSVSVGSTLSGQYLPAIDPEPTHHPLYQSAFYNTVPQWLTNSFINTVTGICRHTFGIATNLSGNLTAGVPGSFNHLIAPVNPNKLSLCTNQTISIPGIAPTVFNTGNVFQAVLVTLSGTTPVRVATIGGIAGTTFPGFGIPSTILGTIPNFDNYRIQITASNPLYISTVSSYVLTISSTPTNTTASVPALCADGVSSRMLVGAPVGYWALSNPSLGTINVSPDRFTVGTNSGVVTIYNVLGTCTSPGVSITINPIPNNTTSDAPICVGQTKNLTGSVGTWLYNSTPGGLGTIAATLFTAGTVPGTARVFVIASGCTSSGVSFSIEPPTTILSQPVDAFVSQLAPANFDAIVSGQNLVYLWRKNGVAITPATDGGIYGTSFTTTSLNISSVPLALNGSTYSLSVGGLCGGVISNNATLNVLTIPASIYRTTASIHTWNNAASWERFDGSSWVAATNYPGQFVNNDQVLIQTSHVVNLSTTGLRALAGATIAGALRNLLSADSIRFNQNVFLTGTYIGNNTGGATSFYGTLINNGTFTGNPGHIIRFRAGIQNNQVFNSHSNITFGLNNQTISGTGILNFNGGTVLVNPGIRVMQNAVVNFSSGSLLEGGSPTSTWEIGNSKIMTTGSAAMPMQTGVLLASNPGATVSYLNTGSGQQVKPTTYYTLEFWNTGPKTIVGSVSCTNAFAKTSNVVITYNSLQEGVLSVGGAFVMSHTGTVFNMNTGSHNHKLILSGATNTLTGTFQPGLGIVYYNGTTNQMVMPLLYNDLQIEGNSQKQLFGNVTINGFLNIKNNATLYTDVYQIAGSPLASMAMSDNTHLRLGNSASGINVGFPSNIPRTNIALQGNSNVYYQSAGIQTVSDIPVYGNLHTGGTSAKTQSNPVTVSGNIVVNPGSHYNIINGSLSVRHNAIFNGSFTGCTTCSLVFDHPSLNQTLGGLGAVIPKIGELIINKSAGTRVFLTQNLEITNRVVYGSNGGILSLSEHHLRMAPTAQFVGFFGIRFLEITGSARVILLGSVPSDFVGKSIPFGYQNFYSPVTITSLNALVTFNSELRVGPVYSVLGVSDYHPLGMEIEAVNMSSIFDFKFVASVSPSLVVGSPNKLVRMIGATPNSLSGTYYNALSGEYGISQGLNTSTGKYFVYGVGYEPSLYRTKSSGAMNWSDRNQWEVWNGNSWIPATTLPGKAVSGDRVIIRNSDVVLHDTPLTYPLLAITVDGVWDINSGVYNNTITGTLTGLGTINMLNGAHSLVLGGFKNDIGSLVTNNSGSKIIYQGSGTQYMIQSDNYDQLYVLGTGTKILGTPTAFATSNFRCRYLQIANGSTFLSHNTFGNITFENYGPSTIQGILTFSGATGTHTNISFQGNVVIGSTGRLAINESGGNSIETSFQDGLTNEGQFWGMLSGSSLSFVTDQTVRVLNPFVVVGGKLVVAGSVVFLGPGGYVTDNLILQNGSTLNNQSVFSTSGVVLVSGSTATLQQGPGSTFISFNAGTLFSGGTGQLIATAPNNNFVYQMNGSSISGFSTNYFHLSVTGTGSVSNVFSDGLNIQGNLYIDANKTIVFNSNTGGQHTRVYGNVIGAGTLQNSNGIGDNLEFFGNVLPGTLVPGYRILYSGGTQQIKSVPNYNYLQVSGGNKFLESNISVLNHLEMNGAIIELQNKSLFIGNDPDGAIVPMVPFGNTNMIVCNAPVGEGLLYKGAVSNAGYNGFVFPLGLNGKYSPLKITGFNKATPGAFGQIGIRIEQETAPYTDYVARYPLITVASGVPTLSGSDFFRFTFSYPANERIGSPLAVVNSSLPTVATPGALVSYPDSTFGNNQTTTSAFPFTGTWKLINVPPKVYRSNNISFNWHAAPTNWEVSTDNGATWSVSTVTPGSTAEPYAVLIRDGHRVVLSSLLLHLPYSTSVLGASSALDLGGFPFTTTSALIEGELIGGGSSGQIVDLGNCYISPTGKVIGGTNNIFRFYDYVKTDGQFFNLGNETRFLPNTGTTTLSGTGFLHLKAVGMYGNVLNQMQQVTVLGSFSNYSPPNVWKNDINSQFSWYHTNSSQGPSVFDLTASGNTFEYAALSPSTVSILPIIYQNLSLSAGGDLSVSAVKQCPPVLTVLGSLQVNSYFNFPTGGEVVSVLGDINGQARISLSNHALLGLGGNFNHTGPMDLPTSSTIHYFGNTLQFLKNFTHPNVLLSGHSEKMLQGAIRTLNLTLSGAVVDLSNYSLTVSGSIAAGIPYSNLNMFKTSGLPSSGYLHKLGASSADFTIIYPVGSGTDYTPIQITNLAPAATGTIGVRVLQGFGYTNSVNRLYDITSSGLGTLSSLGINFSFTGSDLLGTPTNVYLYNPTKSSVANGNIHIPSLTFGQSGAFGFAIDGLWAAEGINYPSVPLGNRGLYFNGKSDSLTAPAPTSNIDNVTLEAWVKLSQDFSGGQIIRVGQNPTACYAIYHGTSLGIELCGLGYLYTAKTLIPNQWYHIAVVRSSGTWSIYVNGILEPITSGIPVTSTPNPLGANVLNIGGKTNASYGYFAGQVDEVRLFDVPRTQAQIQLDIASQVHNGALGYWHFDEPNGSTVLNAGTAGGTSNGTLHRGLRALRVTDISDNGGVGLGSLRQAINDANLDTEIDYIDFTLPSGIQIIQPLSPYPISSPVYIDGYTQLNTVVGENSRYNTNPFGQPINAKLNIIITGQTPGTSTCFDLNSGSSGSIFRGLVVNHFGQTGINAAFNLGNGSNGIKISGCFLGIDRNGSTVSLSEVNNVALLATSSGNMLLGGYSDSDRNLIASGELHWNSTFNNTIVGNYFGTNANGDSYLFDVLVRSILSGSPFIFEKNLMSGSLLIENATSNTHIRNNIFGTGANGSGVVSNGLNAIQIGNVSQGRGSSNVSIYNNTITNKTFGVIIDGSAAYPSINNSILGNNIYGNSSGGIVLQGTGNNNKPAPVITLATTSQISGTCNAGDVVEVFDDTPLSGLLDQGRVFLGRATVVGTNWSLKGAFAVGNRITATASDATNGTSAFSTAATVEIPFIVTSFSPAKATAGDLIEILGSGFGTNVANIRVFMGGVSANVVSVIDNKIRCTVPAGGDAHYSIQVVRTDLNKSFDTRSIPNHQFFTRINNTSLNLSELSMFELNLPPTGNSDFYIGTGDFNGDGLIDLVISSETNIKIYKNTSSGSVISFDAPISIPIAPAHYLKIYDIDSDGKLDILMGSRTPVTQLPTERIRLLRNTSNVGTLSFDPVFNYNTISETGNPEMGDFNGDNKPDIIFGNHYFANFGGNGNTVSLFQNVHSPGPFNGSSFAARLDITQAVLNRPAELVLADFDGDGKLDFAVQNNTQAGITPLLSIYRNLGIGGNLTTSDFATPINYNSSNALSLGVGLRVGDFNGDAKPDLLSFYSTNEVEFFINESSPGNIVFSRPLIMGPQASLAEGNIKITDLNGDGKLDFISSPLSGTENQKTHYFENVTTGVVPSFGTPIPYQTGTAPVFTYWTDFNGDGKQEMVQVYGMSSSNVKIFQFMPTPTISGITLSGNNLCAGSTAFVSITGNGTFAPTNTFKIEISDASGNFPGLILKSVTGATDPNGSTPITIPGNLADNSNYRVRITASNPAAGATVSGLVSVTNVLGPINVSNGLTEAYSFNGSLTSTTGVLPDLSQTGTINYGTDRLGNPNSEAGFASGARASLSPLVSGPVNYNSNFTVALWVNYFSGGSTSTQTLLTNSDNGGYAINLQGSAGSRVIEAIIGNQPALVSTNSIRDARWHFIALVYNQTDNTASLFINGRRSTFVSGFLPTFSYGGGVAIASNVAGVNNYTGEIDNIRFYNRAISENEILALYNEGAPQWSPIASSGMVFNAICENDDLLLLGPSVIGPATFNWNGPVSVAPINHPTLTGVTPAASGTYTLSISKNSCTFPSVGTYSTEVSVNPKPTFGPTIMSTPPYCVNVDLSIGHIGGTADTYTWLGSNLEYISNRFSINPSIIPTLPGVVNYSLTGTNSSTGCTSTIDKGIFTITGTPTVIGITPNPANPFGSIVLTGAGLSYINNLFVAGAGSVSFTNTYNTVSVSALPGSAVTGNVTVAGACGNTITPVLTINSGNLYRSNVSSGNWSAPITWQVSLDGGATWSASANYPGQFQAGDLVSISDSSSVNFAELAFMPYALGGLTVSGFLELNSVSGLTISGKTEIAPTGELRDSHPGGNIVFNQHVWNRNVLNLNYNNLSTGFAELRNGLTQDGNTCVFYRVLFSTNNQTLGGIGGGQIVLGPSTISGAIEILVNKTGSTNTTTFANGLWGNDDNSTLHVGANNNINYFNNVSPLTTGKLIANNPNSLFYYFFNQPITIKSTEYTQLSISDYNGGTPAILDGDLITKDFNLYGHTVLSFSGTNQSNFTITGNWGVSYYLSKIDMSGGMLPHTMVVSGTISTSDFPMFEAGNGKYISRTASAQIIPGYTFNDLIIEGGGLRTLRSFTGVNNLTLTGGSALYTDNYSIAGTSTGKLRIADNSKLYIGNPLSTVGNAPGFPTRFTRDNIMIEPEATVIYQAGQVCQSISGVPIYGNLITSVSGTVKHLVSPTTISGNLWAHSGHFVFGESQSLEVLGNTSVGGTSTIIMETDNPSCVTSTVPFNYYNAGDFYLYDRLYLDGIALNSMTIGGNLLGGGSSQLELSGNSHSLELRGTLNQVNSLSMAPGTRIIYNGSVPQTLISGNYQNVILSNSDKYATGVVSVGQKLSLTGIVFHTGSQVRLIDNATVVSALPFGNTNFINITGTGFIDVVSNTVGGSAFSNKYLPIGTEGIFTPVTLLGLNASTYNTLRIKPATTTTSLPNYVTRYYNISSFGMGGVTNFAALFGYEPLTQQIGHPTRVNVSPLPSINSVTGAFVNTSAGVFGVNTGNNTRLDGSWFVGNMNMGVLQSMSLPGNAFCPGSSVVLSFSGTDTFNDANQILFELSDLSGSFVSPTTIFSANYSLSGGSFPATFPSVPPGTTYRIRVRSTDNASTYIYPFEITVTGTPSITSIFPNATFAGADITVTGSGLPTITQIFVSGIAPITPTLYSDSKISFVLPAGGSTAPITLVGTCGTVESSQVLGICTSTLPSIHYGSGNICQYPGYIYPAGTFAGGTFSSSLGLFIDLNTGAIDPLLSTPQEYTVTYTIPSNTHCPQRTAHTLITITGVPTLNIAPLPTTICGGSSALLSVIGADFYSWGPTVGLNTTVGPVVTASPSTTTTYTVTGTLAGCTSDLSRTVTVLPAVNDALIISTLTPAICNISGHVALISISGAEAGVLYFAPGATTSVVGNGFGAVLSVPATNIFGSLYTANVTARKEVCGPTVSMTNAVSVIKNNPVDASSTSSLNISGFCLGSNPEITATIINVQPNATYMPVINGLDYPTGSATGVDHLNISAAPFQLGSNPVWVRASIPGCPVVTIGGASSIAVSAIPTITGLFPTDQLPGLPVTLLGIELNTGTNSVSFAGTGISVTPSPLSPNMVSFNIPLSLIPDSYGITINNNCGYSNIFNSLLVQNRFIQTSTTIGNNLCVSNPISVSYQTIGLFNVGNVFTARIYDAANTTIGFNIGTLSSVSNSGTINCFLPASLSGTNWRIVVTSSNPFVPGIDNGYPITVTGPPVFAITENVTICSGFSPDIALLTNPSGASFTYFVTSSNPPAGVSGATFGNNDIINQTLTGQGSITYQINATLPNGCTNVTSANVVVRGAPVISTPPPASVCTGNQLTINLVSNIPNTSFLYSVLSASGVSGAMGGIGSAIVNTLSGEGTVMYNVIPVAAGCTGSGTNIPASVTANPITTLGVSTNTPNICQGTDLVLRIANAQFGINYSVVLEGVSRQSKTSDGTDVYLTIPGSSFGIGSYWISFRSASGCGSFRLRDSILVNVNSTPSLTYIPQPNIQTVCQGIDVVISLSGSELNTHYEALINGNRVGNSLTGTGDKLRFVIPSNEFFIGNTIVTFRAISPGCATGLPLTNTASVDMIYTPTINPNFTNNLVCSGQTSDVAIEVFPGSANVRWQVSPISGTVFGASSGTGTNIRQQLSGIGTVLYILTPSVSFCDGPTRTLVMSVTGVPNTNITIISDSVCENTDGHIVLDNLENGVTYQLLKNSNVINQFVSNGSLHTITVPAFNLSPGVNTYQLQILKPSCPMAVADGTPSISLLAPPATPRLSGSKISNSDCDKSYYILTAPGPYLKYEWYYNGAKIIGANKQTFAPLADGNYSATLYITPECYTTTPPLPIILNSKNSIPVIRGFGSPNDTLLEVTEANSYQWYVKNKAIVGAKSRTYKPLYNGTYQVKVNPYDVCYQWSGLYTVNNSNFDLLTRYEFFETDSTIDLSKPVRSVKIYPNPTKNSCSVYLSGWSDQPVIYIKLYNNTGVVVYEHALYSKGPTPYITIERNDLPVGIYQLVIQSIGDKIIKSIVFE